MSRNKPENRTKTREILALGSFRFDPALPELRGADGSYVALRNQSLEVLRFLAENLGEIVPKDELIAAIWGETFVTDDSLVQCISDIRRVLDDRKQSLVQTLPRRGYRLMGARANTKVAPTSEIAARRSIAVFPFTSLSQEPDQAFFAEGLSEDLVVRLSMVRGLNVLAPRSTYSFESDALRMEDAVIKAENALKGSVRVAGNKVRVTVQLIECKSGAVQFSRSFDREIQDIFEIQDDIAGRIISETQVALTEGEAARLTYRQTRSVKAWEYFHQGVLERLKYTLDSNNAARYLFQKALNEDPNYLDALVAEAWSLWFEARWGFVSDTDAALRECRARVNSLIDNSPESPDTIHLDAALLVFEGNYEKAVLRAEAAYETGPSFLFGRGPAAWVHLYSGNLVQAREIYREQIIADPFIGDDTLHYYAHCLTLLGENEEAVLLAEEYRRRIPGTIYGFTLLATAQAMAGQKDSANMTVSALLASHPKFTLDTFRRHEPYQDKETLEGVVSLLREAGLPG